MTRWKPRAVSCVGQRFLPGRPWVDTWGVNTQRWGSLCGGLWNCYLFFFLESVHGLRWLGRNYFFFFFSLFFFCSFSCFALRSLNFGKDMKVLRIPMIFSLFFSATHHFLGYHEKKPRCCKPAVSAPVSLDNQWPKELSKHNCYWAPFKVSKYRNILQKTSNRKSKISYLKRGFINTLLWICKG